MAGRKRERERDRERSQLRMSAGEGLSPRVGLIFLDEGIETLGGSRAGIYIICVAACVCVACECLQFALALTREHK